MKRENCKVLHLMFKMLLPVMLWLISGGLAEVLNDLGQSGCGDFLKNRMTPTKLDGSQYKLICQTLGDELYYVTLYDTKNRIPVYSTYEFTKSNCPIKRQDKWYIEPQLDKYNEKNMKPEEGHVLNNQASNEDYDSSTNRLVNAQGRIFHRGHLAPVSQSKKSQECADATFTLTNAAPQYSSFNSGQWRVVESNMVTTVTSHCKEETAYIVTGVVPGGEKMNNRVKVPSHFWTAYCCQTNQGLISGGAIGVNSKDNLRPERMNVTELERELAGHYKANAFTLFDNNCRSAKYVPVENYNRKT